MKAKRLVTIFLLGLLLFVVGCGTSSEGEPSAGEAESAEEDDHTHSPGDHMAGAHDVPEEAAATPNPIAFTDDSVATGSELFAANCAVCHGDEGLGDGPTAETLETKPANLTADHVQGLSDGALFYIISHGRPETAMPAWEGSLGEEERWNVVNFLRALDGGHTEGDEHAEDEHMEDHVEDEHMEGDEHPVEEHEHVESDGHAEDEHSD